MGVQFSLDFYSLVLWLGKFKGPSEKSNVNMVTLPETNEFSHLKMDKFFDTILSFWNVLRVCFFLMFKGDI